MIATILQRFADWNRELEISRLRKQCERLVRGRRYEEAACVFANLSVLIRTRSKAQVARMERSGGLR